MIQLIYNLQFLISHCYANIWKRNQSTLLGAALDEFHPGVLHFYDCVALFHRTQQFYAGGGTEKGD